MDAILNSECTNIALRPTKLEPTIGMNRKKYMKYTPHGTIMKVNKNNYMYTPCKFVVSDKLLVY
jgi:hypothetical protein